MNIKIPTIFFGFCLTMNSFSSYADNKYPEETKDYMSFIEKTEKDKENATVEIKKIDSMSAFKRENAELSYEREDGIIGTMTNMRDFYNYKIVTDDGSSYLYNKELCYINPYVKQVKIIKRIGWGFFLMPIDTNGVVSEPQDCSAVKEISPEMAKKLYNAIERREY